VVERMFIISFLTVWILGAIGLQRFILERNIACLWT